MELFGSLVLLVVCKDKEKKGWIGRFIGEDKGGGGDKVQVAAYVRGTFKVAGCSTAQSHVQGRAGWVCALPLIVVSVFVRAAKQDIYFHTTRTKKLAQVSQLKNSPKSAVKIENKKSGKRVALGVQLTNKQRECGVCRMPIRLSVPFINAHTTQQLNSFAGFILAQNPF